MATSRLRLHWRQATLNSLLWSLRRRLCRLKQRHVRRRLVHLIEMAAADLRRVNDQLTRARLRRERRRK
jgi:hypothetical protein